MFWYDYAMNHLQPITSMHNRYYVMRHGRSKANELGLIISHPEHGLHTDYGLSEAGETQALHAAHNSALSSDTIIYSSDFSRAKQTAEIVRKHIGAASIHQTPALRERNFGNYEKTSHENYHYVWQHDEKDPTHSNEAVESVAEVTDRVTSFIEGLERTYHDKTFLLVSHGDTLQILQTAFQKFAGSKHRSLPPLETAEIRELHLAP